VESEKKKGEGLYAGSASAVQSHPVGKEEGMSVRRVLCMAVLLVVWSSVAYAGYWDNVSHKADRGFSNILGCWLELPYQPYAMSKEKGIVRGGPLGLGKGIIMAPLRVLSGAVDLATFPVPCPPTGWEGMVQPEYNPWVEEPEKPLEQKPPEAPPAQEKPAQAQ
jgi:putative exosortase-associated protein (TIGR04073 family)